MHLTKSSYRFRYIRACVPIQNWILDKHEFISNLGTRGPNNNFTFQENNDLVSFFSETSFPGSLLHLQMLTPECH